ncbi:hypothetical protein C2845_PM03G21390 [Panicum miliaceum]|uniref:Reverse transcriptase zinc-binding domain-containing protein n=1 Tax=Panicum miliaceum TaxID=4540 RepID=A0A3L6T5I6_PANMI|nr:hypothetical protein C2845_PM03G21390 [Panicum miliaceum]
MDPEYDPTDDGCFSVPIPYQIGNLTKLVELGFLSCDFSEQRMPSWIGNLTKLTSLYIYNCNFSRPIPSTIGNLIQLEELMESRKPSLYLWGVEVKYWDKPIIGGRKIPKSLFALPDVQELDLGGNQLVGSLEDIPAPLSSPLRAIFLSSNQLTGPIPKSFFQLTNLHTLDLGSNKLTGTIELVSIWKLKNLTYLDLGNNMISLIEKGGDTIFSHSLKIQALYLASCNLTKFPASLKYLDTIQGLNLSDNQIEGAIPNWVWDNRLFSLDLSHNMFTNLEKSPIVQMTHLNDLDLSFNGLQGSIPIPSTSSDLVLLDYSNNNFSSIKPKFDCRFISIKDGLRSNQLNGTIRDLQDGYRHFTSLQIVDLASNHFFGELHSEWFENLRAMMNNSNDVGQILEHHTNSTWNGVYQDTVVVTFKDADFSLTKIQTAFKVIDFSNNSFEGSIPGSIGRLVSLHGLNMSHNNFTGQIPSQLHNLTRLESMDLSFNYLSGEIPQEFTSLTSLSWLNLSHNNLTRRIPQGNQFLSFPSSKPPLQAYSRRSPSPDLRIGAWGEEIAPCFLSPVAARACSKGAALIDLLYICYWKIAALVQQALGLMAAVSCGEHIYGQSPIPGKVQIFAWRLLACNGLATMENRKKRNLEADSTCRLCDNGEEDRLQ